MDVFLIAPLRTDRWYACGSISEPWRGTFSGRSTGAGTLRSADRPRRELIVTDVSALEFPSEPFLFPRGFYHLYDFNFFFTKLKENVEKRAVVWLMGQEVTV